ncbi:hypothetical protein DFA_06549 [Cavenderia fasciculata]|uniref:F-box domain-containing protein n=1 Tax=Cavenderia fasciculata TaxID=261658 RepID=F4PJB3_CACFS|nr:uncharacterized protein DFA_06549 [Cavenderia fasciculata]EGG24399.1 hypothetical protein DFA_06549 [Cavenderia fasciculata]|eukprot:XP_004362250.1 hypothetical protein DFA_06549 [Cavenderia fasciculata]
MFKQKGKGEVVVVVPYILQFQVIYLLCTHREHYKQNILYIRDVFNIGSVSKAWRALVKRFVEEAHRPLRIDPAFQYFEDYIQHISNPLCLYSTVKIIGHQGYSHTSDNTIAERNELFVLDKGNKHRLGLLLRDVYMIDLTSRPTTSISIIMTNVINQMTLPNLKELFVSANHYQPKYIKEEGIHFEPVEEPRGESPRSPILLPIDVLKRIERVTLLKSSGRHNFQPNWFSGLTTLDCSPTVLEFLPPTITSLGFFSDYNYSVPFRKIPTLNSIRVLSLSNSLVADNYQEFLEFIEKNNSTLQHADYPIPVNQATLPYLAKTKLQSIRIDIDNTELIGHIELPSTVESLSIDIFINIGQISYRKLDCLVANGLKSLKITGKTYSSALLSSHLIPIISKLKSLQQLELRDPYGFAVDDILLEAMSQSQSLQKLVSSRPKKTTHSKLPLINDFSQVCYLVVIKIKLNNVSTFKKKNIGTTVPYIVQFPIINLLCTHRKHYKQYQLNIKDVFNIGSVSKSWRDLVKRFVEESHRPLTLNPFLFVQIISTRSQSSLKQLELHGYHGFEKIDPILEAVSQSQSLQKFVYGRVKKLIHAKLPLVSSMLPNTDKVEFLNTNNIYINIKKFKNVSKAWRALVKRFVEEAHLPLTINPSVQCFEDYIQHTSNPLCLYGTVKVICQENRNRVDLLLRDVHTLDLTGDALGLVDLNNLGSWCSGLTTLKACNTNTQLDSGADYI